MTKLHKDEFYLKHIIDSISEIQSYTSKIKSFDKFSRSSLYQNATIRLLEIIGEASKNISIDTKSKAPTLPWGEMARFRDRLIHHYFGVDIEIVWEVAINELPPLKMDLEKLYKKKHK